MVERITDNMNESGYEGEWYSYINNMRFYRIRLLDGKFTVWESNYTNNGQHQINTPEVRDILRQVKDGLNEQ